MRVYTLIDSMERVMSADRSLAGLPKLLYALQHNGTPVWKVSARSLAPHRPIRASTSRWSHSESTQKSLRATTLPCGSIRS